MEVSQLFAQSFIANPFQKKSDTKAAYDTYCEMLGEDVEENALINAIEKLNRRFKPFDLEIKERRQPHGT